MELPPHATTLKLPNNANIRILAVSVARQDPDVTPAQPLYDTLNSTEDNGKVEAAKAN
jgi:alpha-mannosidase